MVQWGDVCQLCNNRSDNCLRKKNMKFQILLKSSHRQLLLALSLLCPSLLAATDAVPDLSGIWVGARGRSTQWPAAPLYTAEGAKFNALASSPSDPVYNCVIGFGRIISVGMPMEILQDEDRITILHEYEHQVRRIFMDGRSHPERVRPTLMGHSIGSWEGSTLVIDTIGLKSSYFRPSGIPYSDEIHLTERLTLLEDKISGRILKTEITVEDPKFYQETWAVTKYSAFAPDTQFLEYDCTVRPHLSP